MFGHRALMHFALGGSLSVFGPAIGCIALLDPVPSGAAVGILADLVTRKGDIDPSVLALDAKSAGEQAQSTPIAEAVSAHAYAVRDGSCVVVQMPPAETTPEPILVGIVLGADLATIESAEQVEKGTPLLYFTLERAEAAGGVERTMLGEWKPRERRNYGIGPRPDIESFVETIERVWVSGLWQ
jgi:hypothetical protein